MPVLAMSTKVAPTNRLRHLLQVDSIIMAGNQVSRLPTDLLMYMSHIKKVDLRMNKLQLLPTETAKFHSLEHVTHIDIRDNMVRRWGVGWFAAFCTWLSSLPWFESRFPLGAFVGSSHACGLNIVTVEATLPGLRCVWLACCQCTLTLCESKFDLQLLS